jgi:hypothetical protein
MRARLLKPRCRLAPGSSDLRWRAAVARPLEEPTSLRPRKCGWVGGANNVICPGEQGCHEGFTRRIAANLPLLRRSPSEAECLANGSGAKLCGQGPRAEGVRRGGCRAGFPVYRVVAFAADVTLRKLVRSEALQRRSEAGPHQLQRQVRRRRLPVLSRLRVVRHVLQVPLVSQPQPMKSL